ncbi:hypothetical protein PH30N_12274 [Cutibacterium modestum 30N]|jgi:hypothetical protein|uniref:Uncharacterized protein n=2 Tax=Cutibacterium modestum TaxID=2559073 RepID=A0AAD1KSF1_9ACTN|nr:hypothetical protein HMPREF9621_01428 [Cutibacterium modestum HL037PA2]EFS92789.1 hypothetical protein HMPREF9607_01002 [Cutibacterium modestum HL044PA1]EFT15150.1 hypothetical protein HMPREF9622_01788 [Cutibacterium modestum HL037PA3]EGG26370.1 hypothetical protein PA08_2342 [Cutibacterium modestum P08]MCP2377112.1 hypothetical protein [Cutibacterium modestum 28N]MCP2381714.1 hypothetical protein [Cutibacterium modestum 30N]BCY26354.1 hypothetical protein KB1_23440 [Cutibacterium modestum
MRRVICLFLGVIAIHAGLMSTLALVEQGIDITDMENTGNVTVRYRNEGSHHKPRIKIRENVKHSTLGYSGSYHKHRSHKPGKSETPRSRALERRYEPTVTEAYRDSMMMSPSWVPYWPGHHDLPSALRPKKSHSQRAPGPAIAESAGPTREEIRDWSINLATSIHLAKPVVDIEPQPTVNKWNITAVGQPLWFHNPGSGRHTSSDSSHGIIVSLDIKRVETVYDTGEKTIHCAHSTPRPENADPRAQSPDCGYIYQHPGNYTVRMTEVSRGMAFRRSVWHDYHKEVIR